MRKLSFISIGKLLKSRGKRGEFKFKLYSDCFSKPFFPKVYLQKKGALEEFEVENLRPHKDYYIIKLKEVDTLSQSYELAGQEVLIPEEFLRPLEKDDYYLYQIIGCSVVTRSKETVGTVADVLFVENNNLLVVKKGKREILIPFTEEICLKIKLADKEILIDPPKGLLELDEI